MTFRLYNIWLQDAATATATDDIRADIEQAGLLTGGGQVAGKVAVDAIDLTITGQFRLGQVLSRKHAMELRSLAQSDYEDLPLYDQTAADRKRGYYQVQGVDVQPAHQTSEAALEYTIAFSHAGTTQNHWRAVRTNVTASANELASGADDLIGVDSTARKTRWFTPSSGSESASATDTVSAEAGDLTRYDPGEATFPDPTLLYEVDYREEAPTDVVVYDDRNRDKRITFDESGEQYDTFQYDSESYSTTADAVQWPHVYDETHEFDGKPVVDTGRLRITFDDSAGTITAERWDDANGVWSSVSIDQGDYTLFDADVIEIDPTDVRVFTEWEDTVAGGIDTATLSFQRGLDDVLVLVPENATSVPTALRDVLRPIASDQTDDPRPAQDLIRRDEVR